MSPKKILEARIPLKQLAPAVILLVNSMTWLAITNTVLTSSVANLELPLLDKLILDGLYYVGIALSVFIGAMFFPRWKEKSLLLWMTFGVLTTISVTTFQSNQIGVNAFLSLLLGMSVGMGLPSALAYFADTTAVENRGTYGGLIWLPIGFGVLTLAFAYSFDFFWGLFTLAIWRALGGGLFFGLSRLREKRNLEAKKTSYNTILHRKDLMLYLIPWIMFSLVNFSEYPIVGKVLPAEFQLMAGPIEFAISGVFAVIGGVLSDLLGRKRIVITGFIILGIEYAILSLFWEAPASWFVYTLCDGVVWGLFASVFFMTIWGDLAETAQKEKYYVIGGLPYLLAGFMGVVIQPYAGGIDPVTAFSLASFFLFVAVLPLMYAPETLPEKKIKDRELRDYLEKAKRTRDKYA